MQETFTHIKKGHTEDYRRGIYHIAVYIYQRNGLKNQLYNIEIIASMIQEKELIPDEQ